MPKGDPPLPFEYLRPYYRGAVSASTVLKGRLAAAGLEDAVRVVGEYQAMVRAFLQAVEATERLRSERRP